MVEEQTPPPAEPDVPDAPDAPATPAEPEAAAAAPAAAELSPAAPVPGELSPAECAARLAALFPALFGPPPLKPVKLRIQADIQERAPGQFNKKTLSLFLHRHTTSTAYLKGLATQATRFDLDGQPAGEVAAEHKSAAETELLRRREIVEAKKAAARAQHREQHREQARQQQQQARQVQDAEFAARRERALLLRAFETSTLTRANFCALKQIAEAELEALLERARAERQERPPQPPRDARHDPRQDHRQDHRHDPRRNGPPQGPPQGPSQGPQERRDRPERRPDRGPRPQRPGGGKPHPDKAP